jgi:hypothetical protein
VSGQCLAEHDMLAAQQRGATHIRTAGPGFEAGVPGSNKERAREVLAGRGCQLSRALLEKLDRLLSFASEKGLKIVINLGWQSVTFAVQANRLLEPDRLGKPLMIGEFNDLYKGTWHPV